MTDEIEQQFALMGDANSDAYIECGECGEGKTVAFLKDAVQFAIDHAHIRSVVNG